MSKGSRIILTGERTDRRQGLRGQKGKVLKCRLKKECSEGKNRPTLQKLRMGI